MARHWFSARPGRTDRDGRSPDKRCRFPWAISHRAVAKNRTALPRCFKPVERVGEITVKRVIPGNRHGVRPIRSRPIERRRPISEWPRRGQAADAIQIAQPRKALPKASPSQARVVRPVLICRSPQGGRFLHRPQDRNSPERLEQRLRSVKLRVADDPIQQQPVDIGPRGNATPGKLRNVDHGQPRQIEPIAKRLELAAGGACPIMAEANSPSTAASRPSVVPRSSACRQASGVISQLSRCRSARPVMTVAPSRGENRPWPETPGHAAQSPPRRQQPPSQRRCIGVGGDGSHGESRQS